MSYKYSDEERIQGLQSLNPGFKNQTWHDDIVFHPTQIIYTEFFNQGKAVKEKIDPSKICGIEYFDHYNSPMYKPMDWSYKWLQFYVDLKRLDWVIDNFRTKEKVIDHIHNNKESKAVFQYGDHYFTIGGQHRLFLAKFLELEEVEVTVIKYKLDRERFKREMKFQEYIPILLDHKFLSDWYENNSDHSFVHLDIGNETIFVKKYQVEYILKRYEILKKMPFKGFINKLKSNFVENHKTTHIDDDSQLYLLDSFLLRHVKQNRP